MRLSGDRDPVQRTARRLTPLVASTVVAATLWITSGAAAASHPGCSVQCINKGKVHPGVTEAKFELGTSSPARLEVFVGLGSPLDALRQPLAKAATTTKVQSWVTTLEGLSASTRYSLVVRATDVHGKRAFQHGAFETDPVPQRTPVKQRVVTVSFDTIFVRGDGDKGKHNAGEIEFFFSAKGGKGLHRGEDRIRTGQTVGLGGQYRITVDDSPVRLDLKVHGREDDPGKCIIEAGSSGGDGNGCHYANASVTLDVSDSTGGTLPYFAFSTGDHHLKFTVTGHYHVHYR